MSKNLICLDKSCERSTYGGSRGLCVSHYSAQHAKVKNGHTTWEELEARGITLQKLTSSQNGNLRKHPRKADTEYKKRWRIDREAANARYQELIEKKAAAERQRNENKRCAFGHCDLLKKGGGHGLCPVHYRENSWRVRTGRTTWEQIKMECLVK